MKKIVHRANARGHANHGWLDTHYSFSFANYYNPKRIHFGALRVLNDDVISGGAGFGLHGHENMEIISIPIAGSLEHKDSTGAVGVIRSNEVQIMSAGSGIRHSEYNHSSVEPASLLQIWILPKEKNITPRYNQKSFLPENQENKLLPVVSPNPKNSETLWINQEAYLFLSRPENGKEMTYSFQNQQNGLYLFVIDGEIEVEGETLKKRDALGIWEVSSNIKIKTQESSALLFLEIPMNVEY